MYICRKVFAISFSAKMPCCGSVYTHGNFNDSRWRSHWNVLSKKAVHIKFIIWTSYNYLKDSIYASLAGCTQDWLCVAREASSQPNLRTSILDRNLSLWHTPAIRFALIFMILPDTSSSFSRFINFFCRLAISKLTQWSGRTNFLPGIIWTNFVCFRNSSLNSDEAVCGSLGEEGLLIR